MDGISQVECIQEVRTVGDTLVVALVGDVDMRVTPAALPVLLSLCERRPARLVLHLGKVAYLDSSGLGMLIEVFRKTRTQDGRMVLCNIPDQVRGVIEITHLDRFFTIVATEAEALSG